MKKKNEKLKIILIILGSLLFPLVSSAALVPCGPGFPPPNDKCQLCHLFILLDNVIDFVLFKIVLPVAALLLVVGGVMFLFYAEDPKMIEKGKSILTSVVIGLVIIFAAFLIIGTFFKAVGLADWTKEIYKNWWEKGFFEIKCP